VKKLIIAIGFMFLSPIAFAAATYTGSAGLVVGTKAQHATSGYTVGAGDLLVQDQLYNASGLLNVRLNFENLASASATGLNSVTIATATLVASATTWTLAGGDVTDMAEARNVTILFATTTITSLTGSLSVTGTDHRGNAATETIAISTYGSTAGNVAWRSITSATLTVATIVGASGDLLVSFGTGNKIGLLNDILASANVKKVIEAGSAVTTATVNATYDTIDFATDADGSNDYVVVYTPTAK